MNPSTALASVCVDELIRGGVRDAVVCPGSRSTPLALACAAAAASGRLALHVRRDERSAGFLALGLSKVSGAPSVVVTTSGTAVANLLPAVVEANLSGVPIVLLTADRPPELQGVGANQTIDQAGIFGGHVVGFAQVGPIHERAGEIPYLRSTIAREVMRATGALTRRAGPVHLNVPLRDPLVPDDDTSWPESLDGRPDGRPWATAGPVSETASTVSLPPRTVVIAGDCSHETGRAAVRLAEEHGWPLIAEPSSNAGHGPNAISTGGWLLADHDVWNALRPEHVLVVGRPTLSRTVQAVLRDPHVDVTVVASSGEWPDAQRTATRVLAVLPSPDGRHQPDASWLEHWRAAESAARSRLDAELDAVGDGEQHAVRALYASLAPDALLVAGSSLPIRHVFLCAAPREGVTVVANRGAAGIDGTVSTALGAATAWQRDGGGVALALIGDLTFLHDAGGLALGDEPRPRLTIVVLNNDGGGIFELLEPAQRLPRAQFERVFGTPHGVDLAALCGAYGVAHTRVTSSADLVDVALDPRADLQVVELRTDRQLTAQTHQRLSRAVADR